MPWGISKQYKIIFIHIPKTAGCAICDLLKPVMSIQSNHATINEVEKWYSVSSYMNGDRIPFDKYRPFAVIRNPYDRFVLGYFYERGRRVYRPTNEENIKLLIQNNKMISLRIQDSWINKKCRLLKYENLENELNSFLGEISIPLNAKNMKVIHAPEGRDNLEDYYTPNLKRIVRKFYDKDFKIWQQLG